MTERGRKEGKEERSAEDFVPFSFFLLNNKKSTTKNKIKAMKFESKKGGYTRMKKVLMKNERRGGDRVSKLGT